MIAFNVFKKIKYFCIAIALTLTPGWADEPEKVDSAPEKQQAVVALSSAEVAADTSVVAKVLNRPTLAKEVGSTSGGWALLSPFLAVFVLLCVVVYIFVWARRGGMKMLRRKDNKLHVLETHFLGNRQYLVVVEYESTKILLGVGPGMINQLCFLNTPFENAAMTTPKNDATL